MTLTISNEKIVHLLILMTFAVEAVNGFMVNTMGYEYSLIGYTFRGAVILYFAIKCLKNRRAVKLLLFSWSLLLFTCFVNSVIFGSNIRNDFIMIIRCCMPVTMALGLYSLIAGGRISAPVLPRALYHSIFLVGAIYGLSLLTGIGYVTYEGVVGYKAVFNAVNSLTFALIVLFCCQYNRMLNAARKAPEAVLLLLLALLLILLGAKSGIVFASAYVFLKSAVIERGASRKIRNILFGLLLTAVVCYVLTTYFSDYVSSILGRTLYFYQRSDSPLTFLLSGRNNLMASAAAVFRDVNHFGKYFTGIGFDAAKTALGAAIGSLGAKSVEMDLVDIFMGSGLLGIAATYGATGYLFLLHLKKNIALRRYSEIVIFLMAIAFSVLGGHIFSDSLGSSMLAVTLGMCFPQEWSGSPPGGSLPDSSEMAGGVISGIHSRAPF